MKNHRFILEAYKGKGSRYQCPHCQSKEFTYSLYIDTETGQYIHPTVGRCNREINCGYHYTPKQYFDDNQVKVKSHHAILGRAKLLNSQPKQISSISATEFKASLKDYESNNFVQYLIKVLGEETAVELVEKYFIGTSNNWEGATIFWQIDSTGKIRTGKIMLYDSDTGKRIKEPFNHINWVHSVLKKPDFNLKQCLFGEHLLKDTSKPVAVVESEKTAVIASAYLPQFIWVAVGSLTNLNVNVLQCLKGRKVILFPDLNGYDKWKKKAQEQSIQSICASFSISDLLEKKASEQEREQGLDLADYLLKLDVKKFILPISPVVINKNTSSVMTNRISQKEKHKESAFSDDLNPSKNEDWMKEITEMDTFFKENHLPNDPLKLNSWTTIVDSKVFVTSHLEVVIQNNGNSTFLPYLERLREFKKQITDKTAV